MKAFSPILQMSLYIRTNRKVLKHAAFVGLFIGLTIAFSLPPTYTVEIAVVPKMTWTQEAIVFGTLVVDRHCIAIHSSTIVWNGQAALFLGESGTGKSTHTKLWLKHIKGAHLLNDDSPILRVHEDGSVHVYGSPWSGKTPCYKNEAYPVAGLVRLSQAPYNHICRLPVIQAFGALHPSCPPDFTYDDRLYDPLCDTLNDLLTRIPVYHLACLPNEAAAHLSHTTLFSMETQPVRTSALKSNDFTVKSKEPSAMKSNQLCGK